MNTARLLTIVLSLLLLGCSGRDASSPRSAPPSPAPTPEPRPQVTIRIGVALGGGAAKGFAHIGVIKMLEANGLRPDVVAGTSAGSVVGALYASGMDVFKLQQHARTLRGAVARLEYVHIQAVYTTQHAWANAFRKQHSWQGTDIAHVCLPRGAFICAFPSPHPCSNARRYVSGAVVDAIMQTLLHTVDR